MTAEVFRKKWVKVFVPGITQEKLDACSADQLLWNVFPCFLEPDEHLLSGSEAQHAYVLADKEGALCIRLDFNGDAETYLLPEKYTDVKTTDRVQELYIVASDWSWTYVSTHENGWFGPYFCKRAIPEYEKYNQGYS